jgi:Condensation domain.
LANETQVLLMLVHHIAADGASMAVLADDLTLAYSSRCMQQAPRWPDLPIQYADYALWQRQSLGAVDDPSSPMAQQLAFWRQALCGLPDELNLPTDRPRPLVSSYRGGALPIHLSAELHRSLLALAQAEQASLFMLLQATLAALLSRLGAGEDIAIGAPIAGRTDQAIEGLIGFSSMPWCCAPTCRDGLRCARSCNGCARSIWTLTRTRICRSSCWSMPCNRPGRWPVIRYSRSCWPCRTPPGRVWTCRA